MAERLKGKIAIVTGAGTSGPGMGNGKAAALLFAREGATIVAVDLNAEAAAQTANDIELLPHAPRREPFQPASNGLPAASISTIRGA